MVVQSWAEATIFALQDLWQAFLGLIPQLSGAIVIFVIGWFVAIGVGRLIAEMLKRLQFDKLFEKASWRRALEKAELKVDASEFMGGIVKWAFVIVFLLAAVDILELTELAIFLRNVLEYLPSVIIAVLMFVVTVIIVDIVEKLVRVTVEGIKVEYGQTVSVIIKWAIWIFAISAILRQLEIVPEFFGALVYGFVALIVLSFGLAFGLGGKEVAAELLRDLRNKLRR